MPKPDRIFILLFLTTWYGPIAVIFVLFYRRIEVAELNFLFTVLSWIHSLYAFTSLYHSASENTDKKPQPTAQSFPLYETSMKPFTECHFNRSFVYVYVYGLLVNLALTKEYWPISNFKLTFTFVYICTIIVCLFIVFSYVASFGTITRANTALLMPVVSCSLFLCCCSFNKMKWNEMWYFQTHD